MNPKFLLCLALVLGGLNLPAFAKDDSQTPESSTNILLWPTMNYTNFLAGHPNEARRAALWKYFLTVEREAKMFAGTEKRWKPINAVVLGQGIPIYVSSGRIRLNLNTDWAMFHEIFHDTFGRSPFNQGTDKAWAEAFCDAFRYMMEKKYLPDPRTKWFLKVDHFADETYEQVMAKSGDKHFDQTYVYPASLIVRKANRDLEQFRALWFELEMLRQSKGTDVLNSYFGYDMQRGKPL
jgi:hypothetical protein